MFLYYVPKFETPPLKMQLEVSVFISPNTGISPTTSFRLHPTQPHYRPTVSLYAGGKIPSSAALICIASIEENHRCCPVCPPITQ